jgi:RNA polymerase sporulation-specific sigma factor
MSESAKGSVPTPPWERRLIMRAKRGDRAAQTRLLEHYEPMVRRVAAFPVVAGAERDDLAQHARLGIVDAIADWDPDRRVPFKSFARLCAVRGMGAAIEAARAEKRRSLNGARPLHVPIGEDGRTLEETLPATGHPDEDPVAKLLARERLTAIRERASSLTALERQALALSGQGLTHLEIAQRLDVGRRSVNNALQRARRKLLGPARRDAA